MLFLAAERTRRLRDLQSSPITVVQRGRERLICAAQALTWSVTEALSIFIHLI